MAAPPVGEEVHMPASSALPLINAMALAAAIVAITISWWVVGVAMLIFLATAVRWVRDVKRDIAELPLDHSHH
ncbi:MAG TPA: cytochrome c oxidase subunit 4 [Solirubrobacteraceae bacterium]|nr:cytochrome c oxidase subunit 4 [Solirubrobacteraceae bacterium]